MRLQEGFLGKIFCFGSFFLGGWGGEGRMVAGVVGGRIEGGKGSGGW